MAGVEGGQDAKPKHFLLAALYVATNDNSSADRQWKSFQAGFSAWQHSPNAAAAGPANQDPCKAHRYSRCADSLKMRRLLPDPQRLLLGKTYFTLQQFERAADAFSHLPGFGCRILRSARGIFSQLLANSPVACRRLRASPESR